MTVFLAFLVKLYEGNIKAHQVRKRTSFVKERKARPA
jgi:hypothetical protein